MEFDCLLLCIVTNIVDSLFFVGQIQVPYLAGGDHVQLRRVEQRLVHVLSLPVLIFVFIRRVFRLDLRLNRGSWLLATLH